MDSELNYHLQVIGRASVLAGDPKKNLMFIIFTDLSKFRVLTETKRQDPSTSWISTPGWYSTKSNFGVMKSHLEPIDWADGGVK